MHSRDGMNGMRIKFFTRTVMTKSDSNIMNIMIITTMVTSIPPFAPPSPQISAQSSSTSTSTTAGRKAIALQSQRCVCQVAIVKPSRCKNREDTLSPQLQFTKTFIMTVMIATYKARVETPNLKLLNPKPPTLYLDKDGSSSKPPLLTEAQ